MIAPEVTVSPPDELAVSVLLPAVFSVIAKLPTPAVRDAEGGSVAEASLDETLTVPLNPVAVLPAASRAVTVKMNSLPA